MTPDLNQLRQDLGLIASDQASQDQPPTTTSPVIEPEPEGISLSEFGGWVLTIVGIAIGIWLLADPILTLIAFIWELICAVVSFIINLIVWGAVILIALFVVGSLGK
jgi:hypothetical protein